MTDPRNPIELAYYQAPEFAQDVIVDGNFAYVAGGNDGMWVVNISIPNQPAEVGFYDTPGVARCLEKKEDLVYVADLDRGMRVIDVADPENLNEVGFFDMPRNVRYVDVVGDYAYVSDAIQGIRIIDISDPGNQRIVGFYDQLPQPKGLTVRENLSYVADAGGLAVLDVSDPKRITLRSAVNSPGTGENVVVQDSFAYLADGDFGLRIFDISDPSLITQIGFFDTLGYARGVDVMDVYALIADGRSGLHIVNVEDKYSPKTSSIVGELNDAMDVVVNKEIAYVANGESGLGIVNVSKPVNPVIRSMIDTPGIALGVTTFGSYAFVADGEKGLRMFYVANPSKPLLVGSYENPGGAWDVDVASSIENEDEPMAFYVYIAAGNQGLQILAARKTFVPMQISLFETPGTASLHQIGSLFGYFIPGFEGEFTVKAVKTIVMVMFDFVIVGFLGLLVWLSFFAQFVLPLRKLKERFQSTNRLIGYAFRSKGPAIRIEDGDILRRSGEQWRRGPGVAILDSASAAMLRTKTAFTRPVGPGVVFTRSNEFINQEAFDLHKQPQPVPPLGPLGDENPFEEMPLKDKDTSAEEFNQRQKRRNQTSGLTRDGVEVVPKILAVVKLKSKRGEGNTQFGYNPESIRHAATQESIVPKHLRHVRWFELPAYMAVDVWREYLSRFTLEELFDPDTSLKKGIIHENQTGKPVRRETGLEIIKRMVNERLKNPRVDELDEFGSITGQQISSREYQLVASMGIQVFEISLSDLCFPPPIEERLVHQWISTWLERAEKDRVRVERLRSYTQLEGEEQAIIAFANAACSPLAKSLDIEHEKTSRQGQGSALDLKASLELLLSGTYQMCISDTSLQNLLDNQEKELWNLLEWVRSQ